jgi:hypothetical protein
MPPLNSHGYDPHGKGTNLIQRTLIASSGHRFKLDRRLEERFHLSRETEGVVLSKNEIRETRGRASRIGILIAAETRDIRCEDNRIEGFAAPISDLRKK